MALFLETQFTTSMLFWQGKGFPTVCLGVWERNEKAIRFYLKNGFEKLGSPIFLLGNHPQTDWLMGKNL
ncbi:GNAT family N-acetyltransferase [Flavihumibacter fluvii]|uniref:GNAT family N-acetyltransferase n=1 Tax=Flavihumibacter fluvii TaxID=2838157 RepID=UPI001BDECDAE|nr:hypothetical protein [Flavihumibacter fluvii]ULQ53873.1 hypothetical protein KJS93_06010 [Flavihumibacter fluvii]